MTPDERQMSEIQRGEEWLRETCVDPVGPDVERVKQRMHIALQELWLNRVLLDRPPAGLGDRVKRNVKAALASEKTGVRPAEITVDRGGYGFRVLRWAGGLGLAAAACLALYLGFYRDRAVIVESPYVTAFEGFAGDDLDLSLLDVEEDLTALELAYGASGSDETEDVLMDEMLEVFDELISNESTDQDRS